MPPCMVKHLETSEYQSLSLSDLEWVLILTGASVSKSSLMLTLNNAAQSSETILVAELQQWHTSAPTSCLLISMLNLAHLNRPVELRCVSAASGLGAVMDFMEAFLMHQQRTFSELGFLQVLFFFFFYLKNTDTGVIRKIILIHAKFTSELCFLKFDHVLKELAVSCFSPGNLEDDQLLSSC